MRQKHLLALLSIASIVILFIAMSARQRTDAQQPPLPLPPESTAEPLPVDREKYSPARYGIPETLGGLQVVAVVSHETNPCSPEGFMNVILQSNEPSLDEYLQSDTTQQSVELAMQELKAMYPDPAASVSVVGPIEDMDGLFVRLEENYLAGQRAIALGGCIRFGGPFMLEESLSLPPESTAEPLPVDREKYSPARYGIPNPLGGFEVLAVVGHEQHPCSPEDFIEVHLQESDETWDKDRPNQTSASITAALNELTALYPNAVISTSGRIDDLDTFFMRLEQASIMSQESVATGRCIPLSGGIEALNPTESTAEPLPVDREKYSPARYGVPETLAGFEVVAVVTHETNPCSPEDFMDVYIQVPQTTASEYLQSPTAAQIDEAMAELNQLYPKAGISTFGPYVHADVFFAQLDKTMRQAQEVVALGRCFPLGGPRMREESLPVLPESTAEPLPVDREKYSPARYGIPATLAGFEVLAVVTHEQNPCSPEDFLQVYLQGVESSLEEYQQGNTPANVGKAFDELRLIYPSAVISIGHKVEDLDAFFLELDTSNRQRQQAAATYGCQPLGGPIVEVTPSETE